MSVIKLKMNNDVNNVEPHEELVKKRGDLSDDISNVNYGTFQFNDNIISSTWSRSRRSDEKEMGEENYEAELNLWITKLCAGTTAADAVRRRSFGRRSII